MKEASQGNANTETLSPNINHILEIMEGRFEISKLVHLYDEFTGGWSMCKGIVLASRFFDSTLTSAAFLGQHGNLVCLEA